MKVYLHIGWRKTGSTAIQEFLTRNRELLRERRRIHYPSAGFYHLGHHPLAWSMQSPPKGILKRIGFNASPESTIAEMIGEAKHHDCGAIVISSEEFSSIELYDPSRLAASLEDHDITVIAYVRRQDAYLEALYSHKVRSARVRYKGDIETFVRKSLAGDALDYHEHFSRWAAIFGKDRIKARLYDRSRFPDGDIRRDFCELIHADAGELAFRADDANASLDAESVRFLVQLNHLPLSRQHHVRVVQLLQQMGRTRLRNRPRLMNLDHRSLIVRRFSRSNEKFCREFIGDAGALDMPSGEPESFDTASGHSDHFDEMLAYVLPRLLAPAGVTESRSSPQ